MVAIIIGTIIGTLAWAIVRPVIRGAGWVISIIGARVADKQGLDAAYSISHMFAEAGHVIVSGLAFGCDTAAHEGCLSVVGKTIAIVASGLDITHPKENIRLQERILENGDY